MPNHGQQIAAQHSLEQHEPRYGLGSACIGGGQGAAVIVEVF